MDRTLAPRLIEAYSRRRAKHVSLFLSLSPSSPRYILLNRDNGVK